MRLPETLAEQVHRILKEQQKRAAAVANSATDSKLNKASSVYAQQYQDENEIPHLDIRPQGALEAAAAEQGIE